MTTGAPEDLSSLARWLREHNLQADWEAAPRGDEHLKPHLWRWSEVYPAMLKAAELVPMSMTEMRTVHGLGTGRGQQESISLGTQILLPGEKTRAHRNLKSESRFMLKAAPGAEFIVDGEPFPVEEGDFAMAPTWAWHVHHNGSDQPMIWSDGLDPGLVALGTEINERYVPGKYVIDDRPAGYHAALLQHARPMWIDPDHTPPFMYRWHDTYATLTALKQSEEEGDPYNGLQVRFPNPIDGGPTAPTFSCEVQLLRPRERTRAHRHNSRTIYQAFRGRGVTVVEDERLEWSEYDKFFVPPWRWHYHENPSDQEAILYSITDWPAMLALGLYREEER
jgi:1-hydroxy-2-naphthoate dioxygenase